MEEELFRFIIVLFLLWFLINYSGYCYGLLAVLLIRCGRSLLVWSMI